MGKPKRLRATKLCDLPATIGDRTVVVVSVGPSRDVLVLSLESPPDYRTTAASGASFAKLRADRPNHYRIDQFRAGSWQSLTLPPTKENYHAIQPLGGEGWLLVRARAKGNKDRNAHVYDVDGSHRSSFHAGDGINNVQVTETNRIWVSYFDEGVFGNTTLGQAGLARLDSTGRCDFRFNDLIPDIADCYAFNVSSEREVWLYYYTEFPLVRLVDGSVARIWPKVRVTGSYAFAVADQKALFAGKYQKPASLHLMDLATSRVQERCAVTEEGREIRSFSAVGRGSCLYLLEGAEVFVVDIAALTE